MKNIIVVIGILFICHNSVSAGEFKSVQMKYSRVRAAYQEKEELLKNFFELNDINYLSNEIFIRIFKDEGLLELWAKNKTDSAFALIKSYKVCAKSGKLGPKRREGDFQVPEGFYYIDRFNPASSFHLSLGINYPNKSDRILGHKTEPGGLIFIHGNCVTIGCVPIRDNYIKELFIAAVNAKDSGQNKIPVHIFPCKMTEKNVNKLKELNRSQIIFEFWDNIAIGYHFFKNNRKLPKISIDSKGKYTFK